MKSLLKIFSLLLLSSFVIYSCAGGDNSLSGSVSDFPWWNLSFDRVDIKLYDEGIKVSYLREVASAAEPDTVAAVTVLREGRAIDPDVPYDLTTFGAVDRFVREVDDNGALVEDTHPFPGIETGSIIFTSLGQNTGDPIAGEFFITFTTGYTLNGKFSGDLIVQE